MILVVLSDCLIRINNLLIRSLLLESSAEVFSAGAHHRRKREKRELEILLLQRPQSIPEKGRESREIRVPEKHCDQRRLLQPQFLLYFSEQRYVAHLRKENWLIRFDRRFARVDRELESFVDGATVKTK